MSLVLRILLIFFSTVNLVFVLLRIRKAKIFIADSVFWIMFSALLILFSAIPELAAFCAKLTGIQTAANFMFLLIIFVLILKTFLLSMKLSSAEIKIKKLTQRIAINEHEKTEEDDKKQVAHVKKKYISLNK